VHEHLGRNRDTRNTLDARKRNHGNAGKGLAVATTLVAADATIAARTKAHASTWWDLRPLADTSSMSPSHQGTDHPPTSQKYSGEMNPRLWLEDYRLACQAGGADNDNFIIHNLPNVVGTPSAQQNSKLGGLKRDLHGKFPRHICTSWKPMGSQKLPTEGQGNSSWVYLVLLPAVQRAA